MIRNGRREGTDERWEWSWPCSALVVASPPCGVSGRAHARTLVPTTRAARVPRRLVGYGLVVGLEGTGDRSFGGFAGETPTVRSIVNLLKRFNVVVPPQAMISRNVAAVLVTAEASPYLRSGGRFEVQVSSLGDATSLRGGVLWITPLVGDPNQPPVATAQGPHARDRRTAGRTHAAPRDVGTHPGRRGARDGSAGRGARPPPGCRCGGPTSARRRGSPRRSMRPTAPGTARVEDPGAVGLTPKRRRPIV